MALTKNFFVYFSDFPTELDDFVKEDGQMSILKDGVRATKGGKFPRLTVRVKPVSISHDTDRVRDLVNILQRLQATGQIIGFSQVRTLTSF